MTRFLYVSALALALAGPSLAQPPQVEVPVADIKVSQGFVRFSPKSKDPANPIVSVLYVAQSGVYPTPSDELSDKTRFLLNAQGLAPGLYKFTGVASNGKGQQSLFEFDVPIGVNPQPVPPPGPPQPQPPNPPVPPGPVTPTDPTTLTVLIIENDNTAKLSRGKMLSDTALKARLDEKGHKFRSVTKDVLGPDGKTPADVAPYLKRAADKGFEFPVVFLIDTKGIVRFEGPAPEAAAELLQSITKVGG